MPHPFRHFATATAVASALVSPASAKVDPQIEAAVNSVYPSLVRIYVVSEEGGAGRMQKQRASGSGAIISPDGYIVTNHHVAGRASRIVVNLADRQELRATLVGTDPLADLAVLKIDKKDLRDPNMPLPVAKFGDSSTLAVGDIVLAMGSPAGLSQSVTQGIVANLEMIAPRESMRLNLDSTQARTRLGWHPRWPLERALEYTLAWHQAWRSQADMQVVTREQIRDYQTPTP